MPELDDTMLEVQLRRVLAERLGSLPLDLTVDDLEDRRAARDRKRARRRPWLILGLAAVLILPVGWLAAGAPIPRPTQPSVALETTATATSTPAPTSAASTITGLASPSNGSIAFSIHDIPSRPYNHAHLMNADGTGDREIAQGSCPIFSSDGQSLAYWSGWAETRQLVIANADGSSPRVLPDFAPRNTIRHELGDETLSPDFSQVAWFLRLDPNSIPVDNAIADRSNEVWVTPVSGGPAIRVAPKSATPNEYYSNAVWSPDGSRIALAGFMDVATGDNSGTYRSAIYVVNADGSDLRRLTARSGQDSSTFSWSPDGRYIAYDGTPDGEPPPSLDASPGPTDSLWPPPDIFVIGSDGTNERNLTGTATTERGPKWSPDGSHLAFWGATVPGEQGIRVATVQMVRGTAVKPPVLSPRTNDYQWSPDGTMLLLLDEREIASTPVQKFRTSIQTVDAEFKRAPVTLSTVDYFLGGCASWQPLQP